MAITHPIHKKGKNEQIKDTYIHTLQDSKKSGRTEKRG
jgi:hypothetical protein